MSTPRVKIAVLLSGSGRTLTNILAYRDIGQLPLDIVAVVSSRAGVKGLDIAADQGIPTAVIKRRSYDSVAEHNQAINAWLETYAPQMIVLAGYLCFYLAPEGFAGPIVNIHPALLPKYGGKGYYGDRVHEAVLAAGETESGCTVHLVDEEYDHGRILEQQRVPVKPDDTIHSLADRVFAAECELYPRVLARLAADLTD